MEQSEGSLAPVGVSSHNSTGLLWDQPLEMTQGEKHEPLLYRGASAFVCINTYNDVGNPCVIPREQATHLLQYEGMMDRK